MNKKGKREKEMCGHSYENLSSAKNYVKYVLSFDGRTERSAIWKKILPYLPEEKGGYVLDAACGTGWLSVLLAKKYEKVLGFDSSNYLLEYAKKKCPENCSFVKADLLKGVPELEKPYDTAIFCLAAHDVEKLGDAYKNIAKTLKEKGELILVVANPYYSFPVGSWKRGVWGKILGGKTKLKLKPYNDFARSEKSFIWKGSVPSYFQTLPQTINCAIESGFSLEKTEEITVDDNKFLAGRKRQLHLYPMLLMFVFRKK